MDDVFNLIICGVGGQGPVRISHILGDAAAMEGVRVVTGEMYGLAQRGGSVIVHVRLGERALAPLIPYGEADVVLSLELMEALRYLHYLRPDGTVVTSNRIIRPPSESQEIVMKRKERYISEEEITAALKSNSARVLIVDGRGLALRSGNILTENTVMLGALSALPGFPLSRKALEKALSLSFQDSILEMNMKAFENGYSEARGILYGREGSD